MKSVSLGAARTSPTGIVNLSSLEEAARSERHRVLRPTHRVAIRGQCRSRS